MPKPTTEQLTLLIVMALITTGSVTHSIFIHVKEAKKRKLLKQTLQGLIELKQMPAYINATPTEQEEMINVYVNATLLKDAPQ